MNLMYHFYVKPKQKHDFSIQQEPSVILLVEL